MHNVRQSKELLKFLILFLSIYLLQVRTPLWFLGPFPDLQSSLTLASCHLHHRSLSWSFLFLVLPSRAAKTSLRPSSIKGAKSCGAADVAWSCLSFAAWWSPSIVEPIFLAGVRNQPSKGYHFGLIPEVMDCSHEPLHRQLTSASFGLSLIRQSNYRTTSLARYFFLDARRSLGRILHSALY